MYIYLSYVYPYDEHGINSTVPAPPHTHRSLHLSTNLLRSRTSSTRSKRSWHKSRWSARSSMMSSSMQSKANFWPSRLSVLPEHIYFQRVLLSIKGLTK